MSKQGTATLLKVINCHNTLGENVLWHELEQAIYWIDIEKAEILRYHPESAALCRYPLPERIGSFAFLAPGYTHEFDIIAAFASGFALFQLASGAIKWLAKPTQMAGLRFNDGRTDRQGRFWAGTMVEHAELAQQQGELWRLNADASLYSAVQGIGISNGLCWSPDGKTLYHADSPAHRIMQYRFCPERGQLSAPQLFTDTPENAHPDGSTVDSTGYVWNAHWGAGRVVRYAPDGTENMAITLPVSQPSSVALGGPNKDWLMVTSSNLGLTSLQLSSQPEAGALFIYQLAGIQGLDEVFCQLPQGWLAK
ncbi:SMP-30/gluconolactonase/LRE family protein [Alishewanella tabrizica]|uniref:Gluconolactonase n=1 Tax=Alishewanella tabrizica TaxID=671278 RepID=A0ABQ2WKN0_9ALTE|nr:SMP-30/gluconolactonase/LRE family protein [Alishewanella tabrizica]GGW61273.1 gluconolactonase [Alishewanella tabrizica]